MLQIGSLAFDFPVIQAALSGYSDAPMRRLARSFGASFTLCEVLLDQFVLDVSKRSKSRLYLAVHETDHPCGAQLMGSSPGEFVLAAQKLLDFGFDLIDLNFACPVKKVLGRNRGGSLMRDVSTATEIASAVRKAIPDTVPVTVKLRKGFDDSDESRLRFFDLLDRLVDVGVTGITLHGRTVLQRYQGESDWQFIQEVKEYLVCKKNRADFPVIGSGDLFSAETCRKRLLESGVDGLALARGIIGNPWLFAQTKVLLSEGKTVPPPTIDQQRTVIADHLNQITTLYGEKRASVEMRKFAIAYARLHPQVEELRIAFVHCRTTNDWESVLERFY